PGVREATGLDGIGDLRVEWSGSLGCGALRNSAERPAVAGLCVPRNAPVAWLLWTSLANAVQMSIW
ncbi:hypothetical protein, partial [Frankia sp. Cr2]|uniref:hypothetical protein n=1 Tax=Frankia sp. Cr2 TaxID=3073932 RepID=UPI002AD42E95